MNILGSENINESLQTHFLIYKITNNVNGKYYIGQHMTDNPYDKYMGSGEFIIAAEKKYNLSAFTKEILFDFDNFEDMNNKEKELVPLSACYPYNPMSYNLKEGGKSSCRLSIKSREKISNSRKGKCKGKDHPLYGTHRTKEQNEHHSKIMKGKLAKEKHPLYGTHRTIETKAKLSKTLKERKCSAKENNSNYGKSPKDWMSKDKYAEWCEQKKNRKRMINESKIVCVHENEFEKYIKLGYRFCDKKLNIQYHLA